MFRVEESVGKRMQQDASEVAVEARSMVAKIMQNLNCRDTQFLVSDQDIIGTIEK